MKCLNCGQEIHACTLCDKVFATEQEWAEHRLADMKRGERGRGFRG